MGDNTIQYKHDHYYSGINRSFLLCLQIRESLEAELKMDLSAWKRWVLSVAPMAPFKPTALKPTRCKANLLKPIHHRSIHQTILVPLKITNCCSTYHPITSLLSPTTSTTPTTAPSPSHQPTHGAKVHRRRDDHHHEADGQALSSAAFPLPRLRVECL